MTTDDSSAIPAVDLQSLASLVREVLADDQAEILDCLSTRMPSYGVNPVTSGIYRFSGTARSDDVIKPWSLILKQIQRIDLGERGKGYLNDPADWNYWKREAYAFQSGILERSQGGLFPVQCYAVSEPNVSTVWIWQQDLGDHFVVFCFC